MHSSELWGFRPAFFNADKQLMLCKNTTISPHPSPPPVCVLFTWLTCSLRAASFVHQKAPAPGDCLLTFLSSAALISGSKDISSVFFPHWWNVFAAVTGGLCKHRVSTAPRGMFVSGKHTISSLHYIYRILGGVFYWHCFNLKIRFRLLLKDIS